MINAEYDKKICAWLEAHREQILADWMDLIRIPSVRGEAAPNAPYGIECARALKKAAKNLEERGFPVRLNEEDGYAVASYGAGSKVIGLFGHSDVVPAGDGWLFTEPFTPVIRDGLLFGRGCSDNKAGIMASMCVLEMLRDCAIPMGSTVQAVVGSNEESGMADIEAFAEKEPMPDLSLVPDSAYPCATGEKGILRMWAEYQTPLRTIRDFRGGNAFNIVLDFVQVALPAQLEAQLQEQIAGDPALALSRDGDGLLLEATGIAKHAAYPEGGVNATALAARALAGCAGLDASDRKAMATLEKLLASHYGEGLGIAFTDPDFGALTCANGMVEVIDGKLRVSLDVRYGTAMGGEQLEQLLAQAWEKEGWKIVHMNNRPGFSADKNSPVPQIMIDICREITGKELRTYRMPGGTYARYLKNAFAVGTTASIPDSTASLPEIPAGHGGAHQRDECILIDTFFQGVRVLTHAVIQCDRALHK